MTYRAMTYRAYVSLVSAFGVAALVFVGCDLAGGTGPQAPNFKVTNDLGRRITDLSSGSKASEDASAQVSRAAYQDTFSVAGVIRVTPPVVEGDTTAASYLSFNAEGGDRVFVGYKIRGGAFGGGIDVLNAAQPQNLTPINSLQSNNLDVQEVVDDPSAGAEYVAGAVRPKDAGVSPAVIAKLSFSGNSGNNVSVKSKHLSANVAKSVVNAPSSDSQHDLYVVTDGNSLYRFDADLKNKLQQNASSDAKFSSLTAPSSKIVMLTKSGALWTGGISSPDSLEKSSLTLEGGGNIDPKGIARLSASAHKSSSGSFVFAALNNGGFRVLNADATSVLFSRTGHNYTSVTATSESNYLYASRKDGIVEVYEFSGSGGPSWSSDPIATINTANYGSVPQNVQSNQVLAVGDYLYVANAEGGLLVLEITSN